MKNMKRVLALILCAAMILSLSACSKSGNSGSEQRGAATVDSTSGDSSSTSDKNGSGPIELTVYSQLANFSGEQTGWSSKILEDKFNVKITIIPETDGVFDTRMEAGNLGDIVVLGSTGDDYKRAIESNMLLDWNKYGLLDTYGSYIKEHMGSALEANQQINKELTGAEGEISDMPIYGFGHNVAPSSKDHEEFFYTWDIRWDLYKELGYPVVKDLDDLVTLFEQMHEICPTDENGNPTYAVSLWPDWDGAMAMYVKAMATAYYGYDELALGLYDSDTGTFHGALEKDGPYLTCLKFFNTLNQKGLLDPNSSTQTYDTMMEKLTSGGVFFSIFNYAGSLGFNTDDHMAQGQYMYTMVPEEAVPLCYGMSIYGGNRVWTIGANTEYPDLCMEIINYLCTPEGKLTFDYGPRGLCWDYDENNLAYMTEFGLTCQNDKKNTVMIGDYAGMGTYHDGELQINNTTWSSSATNPETGEPFEYTTWKNTNAASKYDIQQDWKDYNGVTTIHEYMENLEYRVIPAVNFFDSSKSDEFDTLWTQVTNCIVQYSWKAINAKNDSEYQHWVDEMITKANAYGYDQCLAWSENEAARKTALIDEVRK